MNKDNKNVYIKNMEAVDIFKYCNGEKDFINATYSGCVPYSLELIKLEQVGLKSRNYKGYGKRISDDIINVKFNVGYRTEDTKTSFEELREQLYSKGFRYNNIDYVMYKRSGAKARIGNCLFINKKLYDEMISWSKMYLKLPEDKEIDCVSLGAYSSLVSSAIESIIEIDPDNILIIEDVESKFTTTAKEVKTGEDGFLHSYLNESAKISSCFTDGSSLLDSSYFANDYKDKSMMLLRNHMFKSASFNTNIQKFLKDHFKENYESAEVTDIFGNKILAKNIKMICTPNSLKAFKFSKFVGSGTEAEMFEYWKEAVKQDSCIFGICKHEKQTKHMHNEVPYQQMSYQMLNSLPINKEDIKNLCKFELEYIEQLKNNDDTFIKYLLKEANEMNSNEMMANVAKKNKSFINTTIFKNFRSKTVSNYINKLKKGKIKLQGDYCVMISNPYEYLQASLGLYIENDSELILQDNEVYTSLFSDGEELVMFRNPHTSPANVYLAKNKYDEVFTKYFNFSKNIIVVNCIKCEVAEILSGADWDSDSSVVFNDPTLVAAAKKCFRKYNVCLNKISSNKNVYKLNNKEMAAIDNLLSKSKHIIGSVVNVGQLAMSEYWDRINNNIEEGTAQLLEIIDVVTILSTVAIDSAKKSYDLDMSKEIKHIKKNPLFSKNKPNFWQYVSQDTKIKDKIKSFDTPMDMLAEVLDKNTSRAKTVKSIDIKELLASANRTKCNKVQMNKVLDEMTALNTYIEQLQTNITVDNKEEIYLLIEDAILEEFQLLKKRKITSETMYTLICLSVGEGYAKKVTVAGNIQKLLLNMLYKAHEELFLNSFI